MAGTVVEGIRIRAPCVELKMWGLFFGSFGPRCCIKSELEGQETAPRKLFPSPRCLCNKMLLSSMFFYVACVFSTLVTAAPAATTPAFTYTGQGMSGTSDTEASARAFYHQVRGTKPASAPADASTSTATWSSPSATSCSIRTRTFCLTFQSPKTNDTVVGTPARTRTITRSADGRSPQHVRPPTRTTLLRNLLTYFVDNGFVVTATVVDRCAACAEVDLDFSPGAFAQLAVLAAGRVDIEWGFV